MFIDRESRRSQTAKPHWENQLSAAATAEPLLSMVGSEKLAREGQQAHGQSAATSYPIAANFI